MRISIRLHGCVLLCLLGALARAEVLLDEKGAFGPPPDTRILRHTFKVEDPQARVGIVVTRQLLEGESALKILGPD